MAEQGMKIFTGIFKRTYRSLKEEFRKLHRLNSLYLDENSEFPGGMISAADYQTTGKAVRPAADPNMISDSQRMMQSSNLLQMATSGGGFNVYEAQKRVLEAWKVTDIEQVLPDPKGPNAIPTPPHYKVQEAQVKAEAKMADAELKFKLAIMSMLQEAEVNHSKIAKLEAEAVAIKAQTESIAGTQEMGKLQFQLEAAKAHHEGILKSVSVMQKAYVEAQKMETPTAASTIQPPQGM
jgi:hypothetical protein